MAELAAEGLDVVLAILDVTDSESIAGVVQDVRRHVGRLDVLINNAGITSGLDAASRMTVADLRRTYETTCSASSPSRMHVCRC